jgi:hypothetical protein
MTDFLKSQHVVRLEDLVPESERARFATSLALRRMAGILRRDDARRRRLAGIEHRLEELERRNGLR